MKRKFRIKLTRGDKTATYQLEVPESGITRQVKAGADYADFVHTDGTMVDFGGVEVARLCQFVKDEAEDLGAEFHFEEITGIREFRIKLGNGNFNAEYLVSYHEGNPVPLVTTPSGDQIAPLPDGSAIPFDKVGAADLESFVASMAESNGLTFEFVDLHE